jgi:hypothetical protein
MAILDVIAHSFPSGGVSTVGFTASGHKLPPFLEAHLWLLFVGLALGSFAAAATKPANVPMRGPLPRPLNVLVWSVGGAFWLVLAAYFVYRKGV